MHPVFGFTVYVGLMVVLFDWTARKMASAWRAAMVLGRLHVWLGVLFILLIWFMILVLIPGSGGAAA